MKALILEELIWPELKQVLPEIELAVVPVGSSTDLTPRLIRIQRGLTASQK